MRVNLRLAVSQKQRTMDTSFLAELYAESVTKYDVFTTISRVTLIGTETLAQRVS